FAFVATRSSRSCHFIGGLNQSFAAHNVFQRTRGLAFRAMPAFRQVGEKQLPNPIIYMAWSPKRDLIALANTAGELLLHRLANLQRVWCLPPSENTGKEITSLAWRPDGKVLAFSLGDTNQVVLCDVEKAKILHLFPVEHPVTCMHWMEVQDDSSTLSSFCESEDESSHFLPKLPTLPKSEDTSDEVTNLLGDVRLNILVVGGPTGFVELVSLRFLERVVVLDSRLDTGLLASCLPELTKMARKFTHISTLLQYLRVSITCMCEAWEDILTQMDLRLTKFVQEKNTNTQVQDEFLELLLWGHASPELQALLMNQLTVKGLKFLGQSIESSYSSIQKLVISHLQSGSEALLYHLSEVKGMALWKQKFQPLGLDPAAIEAMLRMSEDHVPSELNKMTQKDLAFVADFLSEHFNTNEELFDRKGKYFNVERVGQYLKDEDDDLVSPPNMDGNQWVTFVKKSTHLKDSPLLFPTYPQKSLHFVKKMMEGFIDLCLKKPAEVIGNSVKQAACLPMYTVPERWNDKKAAMHYVVFCMPGVSPSKIYILRQSTDPDRSVPYGLVALHLNTPLSSSIDEETPAASVEGSYGCLDARFYDDETLTVVLRSLEDDENKMRIIAQLPLTSALTMDEELEQQTEGIPTHALSWGNQSREMDNIKAQFVAVNGFRKLACVLSDNLRHIRMFEMDAEEEEEDEERADDSQEMSLDQDKLEESMTNQDEAERGGGNVQMTTQGSGDALADISGSEMH
ncbi:hypothetical protein DNTS_025745, partial [Danionella cerebrum]